MRKAWAIAISLAFVLAGTANARTEVPSGDTCTYSANGATYTVNIVTGGGVQQFGYAFGLPGATITNVGIAGQNGNFTTAKLPPNTTGAWISDAQLTGTSSATLTVSGTGTGPVVVVPAAALQASYYDPITCAAATGSNTGGSTARDLFFTVSSHVPYSKAAGGWHLVVTISAAGTVSARQPLLTSSKVKPKPLVQAKREALNTRGKVTLLLKATPQGQAVLNAQHVLNVKVTVTVDSKDGREAHKTVSLTLRR
jgi:hypothetical protein